MLPEPCNRSWLCMGFLLMLIVSHYNEAGAQEQPDKPGDYDTVFITDMSHKLAVRLYGIEKFNDFSIRDPDLSKEIRYVPNSNLNLGIGVNYKWFGLGIAFNFPFINNDEEKYGKTTRLDAQTHIFARKYLFDLYLQYYKGFFIENPSVYLNNWNNSMPYPRRPDIASANLGGSLIYIINHKKYSAKAAFQQTALQRKSDGSLLIGGYFSILGVAGDSAFFPPVLFDTVNSDLLFNEAGVASIGIAFGYSHTFVFWNWVNFSFTLVPGISWQHYKVSYPNLKNDRSGANVSGRFLARVALTYNKPSWFTGIMATNDSFSGNTGGNTKNSMNFDAGAIRFFYGRRFTLFK